MDDVLIWTLADLSRMIKVVGLRLESLLLLVGGTFARFLAEKLSLIRVGRHHEYVLILIKHGFG